MPIIQNVLHKKIMQIRALFSMQNIMIDSRVSLVLGAIYVSKV